MINLEKRYPQYKITWDEACEKRGDPWMMQIPCEKGIIYPHGKTTLALECKTLTAKKVLEIEGVVVKLIADSDQEGKRKSFEWTLLFGFQQFDAVAKIVRPRKRRKLTEAQRKTLQRYWYRKKDSAPISPKKSCNRIDVTKSV